MVKFASGNDSRQIITEIVNMIKRKLGVSDEEVLPGFSSVSISPVPVLPVPSIPSPGEGKDNNEGFGRLSQFDTLFIIDDTGSMQLPADSTETATNDTKSRWNILTRSLQYIANIAAQYDEDGVDIRFLMSRQLNQTNLKNGQQVLNLLRRVDLTKGQGGTYFEEALAPILGSYVARYKRYFDALTRQEVAAEVKPLNVIVVTDGADDDEEATEDLLVDIGGKLDAMSAPRSQVGIQFLQVGDDKKAAEFLKRLDDDLKKKYRIRDVSFSFRISTKYSCSLLYLSN